MRSVAYIFFAVICLIASGPSQQTSYAELDEQALIAKLNSEMPGLLDKYGVPGAAIGLIQGGEVVWTKGFGLADVATNRPVTPETEFNVGSLSKTPTAWAVMKFVEKGKVGLDQPVDVYLHRWHLPPSPFDNRRVTIRRLLSHTSGISEHDYHGWDPISPLPPIENSLTGKTGTGEVHVANEPGSTFHYSGANYAILELLIEELSGKPFGEYMYSAVFKPLGMENTQYGLPSDFPRTTATPYDSLEHPYPILRYNELAAAGLTTNIRDLSAFAAAGLNSKKSGPRGRGLLKPATVETMTVAEPGTKWADRDPFGPNPQYGLGYTVRADQFAGRTGVGHGGSNNGWESILETVPSTEDGIVIMTNSSNGSAIVASVLCEWRRWAAGNAKDVSCPAIDVRIPLLQTYRKISIENALKLYQTLRKQEPEKYDFTSRQLNSMGYVLMRDGDTTAAIEVFKLNVAQYPQDWNLYDSLGEAYLKAGDQTAAIANYRRSLQLNPENENGREALKKLGAI